MAAQARTTADAAFERIVKKLKKFTTIVPTSLPLSTARETESASWATIAATMTAEMTSRRIDQVRAQPGVRIMRPH